MKLLESDLEISQSYLIFGNKDYSNISAKLPAKARTFFQKEFYHATLMVIISIAAPLE